MPLAIGCHEARPSFDPMQRPEIKQQKYEGKGDYHRLRRQPQDEQEGDSEVSLEIRAACVPSVGAKREQEKKRAQIAFALCNPGHGFHI